MDFIRINIPGQPLKDVKPSDLGTGIKATIIDYGVEAGIIGRRITNDYTDGELLMCVGHSGNPDWFRWLQSQGGLSGTRGGIKKEFSKDLDRSLVYAVSQGHHEIAATLFGMGAKPGSQVHWLLYVAIRKGRHEMAELLFGKGGEIKPYSRQQECIQYADERMKKIIEKGMIESIRRRFS